MPLITCKDCGNDISDKAASCPHCGYKIPVKRKPRKAPAKSASPKVLQIAGLICAAGLAYLAWHSLARGAAPPLPILVHSRMDNSRSTMLKNKETVHATIKNNGGTGQVLVSFVVSQPEKEYRKDTIITLDGGESLNLEKTFEEVRLLNGEAVYKVNVKAR